MQTLESAQDCSLAIGGFLIAGASDLPPATLAHVIEAQGRISPYDRFVIMAEALFAAGDAAPAAAVDLCGGLAGFIATNFGPLIGADGASDPARAAAIVRACRRRLGELTSVEASPSNDPPSLDRYLPPAD